MLRPLAHDPQRRRLAIVGCGRIGIFRREPVFRRHGGEAYDVGDAFEQRIVLVRRADGPAAAVDVKIQPARILRRDDAQLHRPRRPGDRQRLGARRFRRSRKCANACDAARADFLDRQTRRLGIEPAHDLLIDRSRLGGNRGGIEQRGIDQQW